MVTLLSLFPQQDPYMLVRIVSRLVSVLRLLSPCLSPRVRVRVNACVQVEVQRLGARVYVLGQEKRRVPPTENKIQTMCGTAQGWRTKPSTFFVFSSRRVRIAGSIDDVPVNNITVDTATDVPVVSLACCSLTRPCILFLFNLFLRPLLRSVLQTANRSMS